MMNQVDKKVPFAFAVARKVPLDDSVSIVQTGSYDANKQMWVNTDNKITAASCCKTSTTCTSGCYPGGTKQSDLGSDCGNPPY